MRFVNTGRLRDMAFLALFTVIGYFSAALAGVWGLVILLSIGIVILLIAPKKSVELNGKFHTPEKIRDMAVNKIFAVQFGIFLFIIFGWTLGGYNLANWVYWSVMHFNFSWIFGTVDSQVSTRGWHMLLAFGLMFGIIWGSIYRNKTAEWGMPLFLTYIRYRSQTNEGWHIKLPWWLEKVRHFSGAFQKISEMAESELQKKMIDDGAFRSPPVPTRGFPGISLGSDGETEGRGFDTGTGPEVTAVLNLFLKICGIKTFLGLDQTTQDYPARAVLEIVKARLRTLGDNVPYTIFINLSGPVLLWLSPKKLEEIQNEASSIREVGERAKFWAEKMNEITTRKELIEFTSSDDWEQIEVIGKEEYHGSLQHELFTKLGVIADCQIEDMEQQASIKDAQEQLATALLEIMELEAKGAAAGAEVWAQAATLLGIDPKTTDDDLRAQIKAKSEEVFDIERGIEALNGNNALIVPGDLKNLLRTVLKSA